VTAVAEIAANIVRHAYAGRANGRYRLRLLLFPGRIEARFYDWGGEFHEPAGAPREPPADPLDIAEGGYGLLLARAMLDALEYDRCDPDENRWRLVKLVAEGQP
jgi:anti-sigma regulatory factor (Ser/Thr protein kinase)